MTDQFDEREKLYRAVYPPEIMPLFWKENGEISSAVFKDKKGLSVERALIERHALLILRGGFGIIILSFCIKM